MSRNITVRNGGISMNDLLNPAPSTQQNPVLQQSSPQSHLQLYRPGAGGSSRAALTSASTSSTSSTACSKFTAIFDTQKMTENEKNDLKDKMSNLEYAIKQREDGSIPLPEIGYWKNFNEKKSAETEAIKTSIINLYLFGKELNGNSFNKGEFANAIEEKFPTEKLTPNGVGRAAVTVALRHI
jgi:hypothetical protein